MIIPMGHLTLELHSTWISKLNKIFKVEYRILEFNDTELYNLKDSEQLQKIILFEIENYGKAN